MPRSNKQMIKKLQGAINGKFGEELLIDRVQWYSEQQKRPVTLIKIKKPLSEEQRTTRYRKYQELFSTTSEIQIVLFLRDYWYQLNNWPIPNDNENWNKAKEYYYSKK